MGERTLQAKDFPEPGKIVGAFQSYLRRAPGAPEYGAIGGTGYDRVVHGPLFTSFVLGQTCELQGRSSSSEAIAEQTKAIHHNTQELRFPSGRIIPSVGRQILNEYAERRMADPHVEVARRLAAGLTERDHESAVVAQDVQILLSRVALDGGFDEVVTLPDQTVSNNLQAAVPDVA